MLDNLILGFQTALTPENLLWCLIGVVLGTVIGLMPGLGSTTGVAILIPLTLTMEPVTALIMLAGIYYGAQYGSSITSILIATPGDSSSVVTVIDGYQLARKGKAGVALAVSAISSFGAAIISLIGLMLLAPLFAQFALNFGPVENLAVMTLGLLTVASFAGAQLSKALVMTGIGLLVSTVGVAAVFSDARYTFGSMNLLSGIPFIEVMIGLFAISEVLYQLRRGNPKPIRTRFRDMIISRSDMKRIPGPTARGGLVGFILGALPGAGATLATFMAYGFEKRVSKNRDQMGKGAIEGVASPEAANNSAANASLVPTLALGIPGGGTTAVLLGAFTIYGLQPGPLLFDKQPALVWGLLVSFFIGNLILLVLNLPLAPVFAMLLRIRYTILYPIILLTSLVGAFAVSGTMFGVWVALIAGVIGYVFKVLDLPVAPLVLGLVLGPLFEKALVQTSALGDGNFGVIFSSPIALIIFAIAALFLIAPVIFNRRAKRKATRVHQPQQPSAVNTSTGSDNGSNNSEGDRP